MYQQNFQPQSLGLYHHKNRIILLSTSMQNPEFLDTRCFLKKINCDYNHMGFCIINEILHSD